MWNCSHTRLWQSERYVQMFVRPSRNFQNDAFLCLSPNEYYAPLPAPPRFKTNRFWEGCRVQPGADFTLASIMTANISSSMVLRSRNRRFCNPYTQSRPRSFSNDVDTQSSKKNLSKVSFQPTSQSLSSRSAIVAGLSPAPSMKTASGVVAPFSSTSSRFAPSSSLSSNSSSIPNPSYSLQVTI